MMTAIESSGGMAGVSVTVSGPQPTAKSAPVKWEGVSFINNIEYSNDGMQVWRAYGIGCGKFLPWSNFGQASSSPLPHLNKLADNASSNVSFEAVKARQRPEQTTELASATEKDSDEESSEKRSGLFHCPEEGCVKSFQQYSSLEKHLDCDTHKYALEHETLYDKARVMYAAKLEHGAGADTEKDIQELTEEVMKTFALQHPIMFEKYNICEIVCQSKLSKFSVGMLREICTALELDVYSITSKLEQPYMDILQRLVDKCSCKTMI